VVARQAGHGLVEGVGEERVAVGCGQGGLQAVDPAEIPGGLDELVEKQVFGGAFGLVLGG